MDNREKILLVALELFNERGSNGTSIADIANAADVSKGTLYYYFPTKESLVNEAVNVAKMQLSKAMPPFAPDLTIASLFQILTYAMLYDPQIGKSFFFLLDQSIHSADFRGEYKSSLVEWRTWWKELLDARGYENTEDTALVCSALIGGLATLTLIDPESLNPARIGEVIRSLIGDK